MSVNNKLVYIFKAYPGRWVGLIITNSPTQLSSVLRPITQDQRVRTRAFGVPVKTVMVTDALKMANKIKRKEYPVKKAVPLLAEALSRDHDG